MSLIRRLQPSEQAGDIAIAAPVPEIAGVRVCTNCRTAHSGLDAYCTVCGAELPTSSPALVTDSVQPLVVSPPIALEHWRQAPRARRSLLGTVAVFSAVALGIAGTATFGWLWHTERAHAREVTAERGAATRQLASTRRELAGTVASLQAATALAGERKAVLLRAQAVLGKVDLLLSAADGVQRRTTDIQSAGESVVSASETMVSDAVTLGNYLIQTDPAYIDGAYEGQLIDSTNASIAYLRDQEAALYGYNSSYGAKATRFGNVADAFTTAVRRLQQQLQAASR